MKSSLANDVGNQTETHETGDFSDIFYFSVIQLELMTNSQKEI